MKNLEILVQINYRSVKSSGTVKNLWSYKIPGQKFLGQKILVSGIR